MNSFLSKRSFSWIATVFCISLCANAQSQASIQKELAALETSSGGRLGVYAINTMNNERIQYRAEERCDTSR